MPDRDARARHPARLIRMPIIDIIIGLTIVLSVLVGFVRGFVKEAVSIGSLLVAIWAALYLGPSVGQMAGAWLPNSELATWFGRILVFAVILLLGGLLGWGLSKLVKLTILGGLDRFGGAVFGLVRGILLIAVGVIGGEFAGFSNERWWLSSTLVPHFAVAADWIRELAPAGYDLIVPDAPAESLPVELPGMTNTGSLARTGGLCAA